MSKRIIVVWCSLLALTAVSALAEDLKIGAGAAASENVFKKIQAPLQQATGLNLILLDNGPYEALVALDKGEVEAAAGGLTFADWMSLMDKKGYAIADKSLYKNRIIGKDVVQVITHPDTKVTQLDKAQLKGLFTGKIANWKEVGGPDLPVVVIFGAQIPGTQAVFAKQVMDDKNYTAQTVQASNAPDVKARVASTPGAIGLAPKALLDATVLAPAIPEVGRPITLITKGEPSPALVKMLDFLRTDGKKYLDK